MNHTKNTPLKNYFLLGDLHSAALLSKDGAIDWLCWPHFDSPSVFARLLDPTGGCFSLLMDDWQSKAAYRERTAMVDTEFSRSGESFKLTDFMVPQMQESNSDDVMHLLIRNFSAATNEIRVRAFCDLKPDFARQDPEVVRQGRRVEIKFGHQVINLHIPENTDVTIEKSRITIAFSLLPNENKQLALEFRGEQSQHYEGQDFERGVERYWHQWVENGQYEGSFKAGLIRSAITLKLMQFYVTGALIAAPTCSLPECFGGQRNWDYRYTWVRDATMSLYALQLLGHVEEATRFFQFIEKVTKESDSDDVHIKLMYTIDGLQPPKETILSHLVGYRESGPVRLGNSARHQFQLDVYGSTIDAYYFMYKKGILPSPPSKTLMLHLAQRIEELWMTKDSGIWEFRNKNHRFTYSRVMAWVGIDRLLMMCRELGFSEEQISHYEMLKQEIHEWIWANCYDEKRKIFRQHPHSEFSDATTFMFVMLRFLKKSDPLTKTIIQNTAKSLLQDGVYVYRYRNDDGFKDKEGAFLLCSYWYITALAAVGEVKKAEAAFKKLDDSLSESGLIAEEIDPHTGEYLGNFPQAFSHIGYIMAARRIEKMKKGKKSV